MFTPEECVVPSYSFSGSGHIYSALCHGCSVMRVKGWRVQPTGQAQRRRIGKGGSSLPKDTLTLPQSRKKEGEKRSKKKGGVEEALCHIFIQLSGPVTGERPQIFSLACLSWRLSSLETNQLPQLLSHHHHSHFSPAPVPREFPEKQGCQQRQNQAGWEQGWLSLSGPLTAHQLTGQGLISLRSPSEFLCLCGVFPPKLEHIESLFRGLLLSWKGVIGSAEVSWNVTVQNETGCLLLCYVVTLRVKYFNQHCCCILWIGSFNLPIFFYLFFSSPFSLTLKTIWNIESQGCFWFPGGSRSVSCQFCCGHGSFHSYMLLSVAKYCVLLPPWKWNGPSPCVWVYSMMETVTEK